MKILFIAQQLPYPLDSGGKIKSYHFLKALSQKHEIVLLSLIRSEEEKKYLKDLKPFCGHMEVSIIKRSFLRNIFFFLLSVLLGKSFMVIRDFSKDMRKKLRRLIEEQKPDVLHLDHLQMFQYLTDEDAKIVLDEHNVEYVIIERIAGSTNSAPEKIFSKMEYKKLRQFEKKACQAVDLVLTVTEEDKKTVLELTSNEASVETVPIGVDTNYFTPLEKATEEVGGGNIDAAGGLMPPSAQTVRERSSLTGFTLRDANYGLAGTGETGNTVIFVGTMFWPPNVDGVNWFVSQIWPLIKRSPVTGRQLPIKLQIIGRKPAREIKKMAQQDRNIEVIEYADDIRPYMHNGKVFVVPLRQGSGMRVKILNAFAAGIPVVSTAMGAEGIGGLVPLTASAGRRLIFGQENLNNKNIIIADEPQDFAAAVTEIIHNDRLRKILSENARKLAEEKYSWNIIDERLMEVYKRMEK